LGRDETDFSGAGAEIEYGFSRVEVLRRIATAVVFFDDLGGNGLEVLRIIIDRAAEGGFGLGGSGGVAFAGGGFSGRISWSSHGCYLDTTMLSFTE